MKPIFKILYRIYRLISAVRYWVRRRFTRPGLALLVALAVMGAMGVDTENTVAYQAFALILFLLLVSICCSWGFRARFSAQRRLPRFGTVGQILRYKVALKNQTAKTQSGLTLLEDLVDVRPSFDAWLALQLDDEQQFRSFRVSRRQRTSDFSSAKLTEAAVPAVRPNQEAEATIELTPLRRGPLRFGGLTLARPDPLGLFRTFARLSLPQSVLILPKRYSLPPLALPGTLKYQPGGVALASNVGQSEEFVSLREYRHGDPLRHIHWRTWARVGKPVVKEFEDEFFVRHALVLDTFTEQPRLEVFEEAVSVAASFACTIQSQESLLDLLFVGPQSYCFTAGRGLAEPDQMLEILASVGPCQDVPFRVLERLVLNHVNLVSGCICILLAWNQERRQFIEKLQALNIPLLVLVIVPSGQRTVPDLGPTGLEPGRFLVLEAGRIQQDMSRLS